MNVCPLREIIGLTCSGSGFCPSPCKGEKYREPEREKSDFSQDGLFFPLFRVFFLYSEIVTPHRVSRIPVRDIQVRRSPRMMADASTVPGQETKCGSEQAQIQQIKGIDGFYHQIASPCLPEGATGRESSARCHRKKCGAYR